MPETITVNQTVTTTLDFKELPEVGSTLPPDAFGCHVRVAKPIPGLLVFEHTAPDGELWVAETTENRADAPASLDYALTTEVGQRFEVKGHKRLRRTWFLVKGSPPFMPNAILQANSLTWNDWMPVEPMSLGKIVPDGEGTDNTGGAPEHGIYPAWSNNYLACIHNGKVHGHLPMALRDPVTLQPVRDTKVTMGFNPVNVKGVSVSTLGNKCDTSHCWASLPAYLAAKGTVLERFYAECMEFVALHAILSDYPGQLWRKQVRGQGRSLRNVVDWLNVPGTDNDDWYESILIRAATYYSTFSNDPLAIERGIRVSKPKPPQTVGRRCVAGFEWAHLLYGLWRVKCEFSDLPSMFLVNALNWFARVSPRGIPYEINVSDPGGKDMPLWDEERIIAEEKAAGDATPTRYDNYRAEAFVMDWLRYQLDLPTLKPLDAPEYLKLRESANTAGFALPWKPKPKWTFSGKTFTDLREAKQALRMDVSTKCDQYDGEGVFDYSGRIARV